MENSQEFTLRIMGREFDNGYNLYYLSKGLSNFNNLIDKSYLTIEGKKRMTEKDREIIIVRAYNIRPGSFQTDFLIHLSHLSTLAGSLLPMVTSMTPESIWKLVTDSFNYLNIILSGHGKGEAYSLEASDSSLINVINGDGNIIIQVHPDTLDYVKRSEKNFEELTKMIDPGKGVESISVIEKSNNKQHLYIGAEEKMNFENKKRLEPDPITFRGIITKVDGEGFNGKLRVIDGNGQIDIGEYHFEFLVKDNPEKLKSAFLNVKKIVALKETILNTSSLEHKIYKLKIIETA